jgi:hypothetical protein
MELARKGDVRDGAARVAERQQLLAAAKFMGLTQPPPAGEPSPDWIAKLRSLLCRAAGRLRAARP